MARQQVRPPGEEWLTRLNDEFDRRDARITGICVQADIQHTKSVRCMRRDDLSDFLDYFVPMFAYILGWTECLSS